MFPAKQKNLFNDVCGDNCSKKLFLSFMVCENFEEKPYIADRKYCFNKLLPDYQRCFIKCMDICTKNIDNKN